MQNETCSDRASQWPWLLDNCAKPEIPDYNIDEMSFLSNTNPFLCLLYSGENSGYGVRYNLAT